MGASEVLKYIEIVATSLTVTFGALTAIVALKYRKQIVRGEKIRAEKRRAQTAVTTKYWHQESESVEVVSAGGAVPQR